MTSPTIPIPEKSKCRYAPGQSVVVDRAIIFEFVRDLPDGKCIVKTRSGSIVVDQSRLSLEREVVDA